MVGKGMVRMDELVIQSLRRLQQLHSQRWLARELGFSVGYINMVLLGKRRASKRLLEKLGLRLEKVVVVDVEQPVVEVSDVKS